MDFPSPPQWLRGLRAKIAASTVVLDKGGLLIADDGTIYGGDGVTQIKNLPPVLTKPGGDSTYVTPLSAQTFTAPQQAQARTNIDAPSTAQARGVAAAMALVFGG